MDKVRAQDDRRARLLTMGDAIEAAGAAADWERLAAHVNALAPALASLAARGPWSGAERAALERLRRQHDAAAAGVAGATDALAARLDTMGANKEGWLAYAMHNENEQGASRE